ncbi:Clavaminate synthase-like protein [Calocera viscosa TUFC12733]|uniref:Clavaminate synthase-like protein n=1 Tax=Calocera viscosa (strain TUFC12733) TaxID=1330018 RepID=A0A167Q7B3_CALVF|nr:Clavaminate synthase-like protein [Calocera viscosa TUFC12733]
MPVAVPPTIVPLSYDYVKETKEDLDWAELVTVDLGDIGTPEGKQRQAKVLIEALRVKGFFYVKNFNISQDRVNRQFALGNTFYNLPLEEKLKYVPDLENGEYNGYRPAGRRVLDVASGLTDRVEVFNMPKFNGYFDQAYPQLIKDHIVEIEEFARSLHSEILDHLFTLLAIALELPEDYFVNLHKYEQKSEDHLRYMKYGKYTPEENKKLGALWGRGHTDLGTFTLLFRQPVAALQIKDHTDGKWRWVKPQDATVTVNACDALSLLTGGYVKSTIHRVAVPPRDQQHVDRLGLLYFARPKNDLTLATVKESPVLQRDGFTQNEFEAGGFDVPTMEQWTYAKQKWQQSRGSYADKKDAVILPGFKGQFFD